LSKPFEFPSGKMMSYIQHAASVEIFVKYDVHLQSRDRSWEEEEYTSPCRLFEG
jgi:hypothetical protein